MDWQVFDLESLLILTWITAGKLFTVPLVTWIARSKDHPLFVGEIKPAQTRLELASVWLLITDAVVLALILGAGLIRLEAGTPANTLSTFVLMAAWGEVWMYWTHRWMHRSKLLWAWHRHHHMSRPPQALSSISFSIAEKLVFYTLGWLVFVSAASWVLPVSLWGIAAYYTFYFFASPIAHSNSEAFGFLTAHAPRAVRSAMGTAQTHGQHHMRMSCNFGFMTVVLDRLFGTFQTTGKTADEGPKKAGYQTFAEFYPFYLSQHRNPVCRTLHVAGVVSSLGLLLLLLARQQWLAAPLFPLPGYACGWIGHFVFEKNRPASFRYPFYSFAADIRMAIDILFRRQPLRLPSGGCEDSEVTIGAAPGGRRLSLKEH
jgi:hypothetical protein